MGNWDTYIKKVEKRLRSWLSKRHSPSQKNLTSVNVSPISGCLNGLKKEASRRECNLEKKPNYTVLYDSNSAALKPTP